MCQVWCSTIQGIYARLMGGPSAIGICALSIYIYRSAMRCAKFGVAVFKASLLDWGSICHWYLCIVYIYIDLP